MISKNITKNKKKVQSLLFKFLKRNHPKSSYTLYFYLYDIYKLIIPNIFKNSIGHNDSFKDDINEKFLY